MAGRAADHAVTSLLTVAARRRTVTVELETSYKADNRPRHIGGIFMPSLWRESGSGNARGCPCTVFNSRRQGGLETFLAACFNAYKEAAVTGAQPHPSHDRRDRIGDLNRYPERNVSRKRATKRRRYALSPWNPLVGSAAKTGNADRNVRAYGRDGRERPASSLPVELAAGGLALAAGCPPRFFGKGGVMAGRRPNGRQA